MASPVSGDDWFELYNPGPSRVDLGGYFLTDNLANKFQFQVPNNGHYTLPPGGYLLVWADSDFQIGQVMDILLAKLTKRTVDARYIDRSAKIEKIGGDKVKQLLIVKNGIDSDTAKKIQSLIKQSKLKVQAAIQGDVVRVTGTKRDDLQAAMALIRKDVADAPLTFTNFRD